MCVCERASFLFLEWRKRQIKNKTAGNTDSGAKKKKTKKEKNAPCG